MKQAALLLATGAAAEVVLHDKFDTMDAWKASTWKSSAEMKPFEIKTLKHDESQKCLATTEDARFYAASTTFKETSFKDKSLLVQYEVTYDQNPECGGGYIKLGEKLEDQTKFGDPSPYYIMFGPDQCGYTKRTHLIFSYNGKNILKKVDLPYKQSEDGQTSIYRLLLTPAGEVTVSINDEQVYTGSIGTDWELLPAKEIDDPDDKKPEDWVDEAMIDDPEDKKPEDWVETKETVDKEAKKPEDWDAEEDGEWEAPMVPNPDYKGEWSAKRISNPAYKGVWAPKKIANPEYPKEEKPLYLLGQNDPKLSFAGFDLWQVKSGSRFDNLIISIDKDEKALVKEADSALADWKVQKTAIAEKLEAEKQAKKEDEEDATKEKDEEVTEVDDDDDGKDGDEVEKEDL